MSNDATGPIFEPERPPRAPLEAFMAADNMDGQFGQWSPRREDPGV